MHKFATFLFVAAAISPLAGANELISEPLKITEVFAAPNAKCYFIRQTNRQMQTPKDKPQFMPLAGATKLPAAPVFANCMPDQRIIKIGSK